MKKSILILFLICSLLFLTGCNKNAVDYSIYTIDQSSTIVDSLTQNNIGPDELTGSALTVLESLIQGDFDEAFDLSYQTHSETHDTQCLDPSSIERYLLSGDLGDNLYSRTTSTTFLLQNTEIKGTGTTRTVVIYLQSSTGNTLAVEMLMTLSSENQWLWNGKWATIQKLNVPKDASLAFVRGENDMIELTPTLEGSVKNTYELYLPIGELLFSLTDADGSRIHSITCNAGASKSFSVG